MKKLLETQFLVYLAKCIIGLMITYTIYVLYPQHQFFWSVISVLLAFSPDDKDAKKVAYDRMKANVLGSTIGMIIFVIHVPSLLFMCLGVLMTIVIATILNIQSTTRSALAAVIIVLLYEKENASYHMALERMFCVIVGCLIALLLTLLFDFIIYKDKRKRYIRKAKVIKIHYTHKPKS
ncbi:MAG TPA: FUSC family protein [Arachidicoccus soli]|nr:FUSC family protein [Arachidicoccus soli]HEU0226417.1 FUSC family protein [Arachidicoccus soli]